LLQAFVRVRAACPAALLVIGGDGTLRGPLQQQTRRTGIADAVRFIGWQEDVPAVLSCFDIFCLPTLREGFGYVFMEAQAMGVAVIATRIAPLTETMEDEETALLVPPQQPEALAAALQRCVCDEALRARLAQNGAARVHARFSLARQLTEVSALYQRVRRAVLTLK